jgi:predicted amidohydrolase YtcJ
MTAVDLVLHGGTVWTPDHLGGTAAGPSAVGPSAVAVRDGVVLAVGPEAAALADDAATVVDLEGGALLPSFGDGHAHPIFAGLAARLAPIGQQTSVEGVVGAIADWAEAHPDEPWVRGDGYDPTLAPDGVFDARWLDAVVPDRPVWLRASDYHTAWVNTRALELAGITEASPQPRDGEVVRRPDGSVAGTLREWGAWSPVAAAAPPIAPEVLVTSLLEAATTYAGLGVTWVQDAWADVESVDTWLTAAATGRLSVRGNLALLVSPASWRSDLTTAVEQRNRAAAEGRGMVTANTVKLFADGVVEAGTAALLEPYHDCPHSRGLPNWEWAELTEAVVAADAFGLQAHIHAIGDAGVRAALEAVEAADRRNGPRDRRAVVAHAQLVDPLDLPRFAALGVVANFEPLWACRDELMTRLTEPRLGKERSGLQYPIATLLRSGQVSFGSDWPVSSPDPRAGIAVAVTREPLDSAPGAGWLPDERITVQEAIEAYSSGVAYQAFEQHLWGRIQPGTRADLVWLESDPRMVSAHELPGVEVRGTWLAGHRTA